MGEYFGKHFIATHQQIGRFEVVDNHGAIQKNGGNVASCFCTPDGRVIHAVLGPARADVLIEQAKWAVNQANRLVELDDGSAADRLANAHRSAQSSGRTSQDGQVQKVHNYLAAHPLAQWDQIAQEIFTRLLNEKIELAGSLIRDIPQAFEYAQRRALPIVWILYPGKRDDAILQTWKDRVLNSSDAFGRLAESYVVIALPRDEMAALSHKLKLRPFAEPDQGQPLFVISRSNGKQLSAVTTWARREDLTVALAQGLIQEAKERPRGVEQVKNLATIVQPISLALARELGSITDGPKAHSRNGAHPKRPSRRSTP